VNKLDAEIILEYDDEKIAKAITEAVSPDNFKTPKGLLLKTIWQKEKVLTEIKCEKGLQTFIATLDDLLFCISTAEKTIQTTKKFK
jgi:tRNA threonylcarbamoyladenosine modification (KEOPS) complex  Pcc1 subunit